MPRKLLISIYLILVIIINIYSFNRVDQSYDDKILLNMSVKAENQTKFQVYYNFDEHVDFSELLSESVYYYPNSNNDVKFYIPAKIAALRLDFGEAKASIQVMGVNLVYRGETLVISEADLINSQNNMIEDIIINGNTTLISSGNDPFLVLNLNQIGYHDFIKKADFNYYIVSIICIFIDLLTAFGFLYYKYKFKFIKEIYDSRKMIISLAKNDFKTKYSGSYFGIIWAFVQPMVTVLIYVFVFQVAFKAAPLDNNFPFVLWLIAGLVPWFFFGDALITSTNSLSEYSYLVKKVVFQISTIPIVKILSSLFIHSFFLVLSIVIFSINGYFPNLYYLQLPYYIVSNICLVLALSYITASIQPFFKDFTQIVNIFVQIGMWLTPIMWNLNLLPTRYQWILKLNPMYYIVEGYRNTLMGQIWFWEKPSHVVYFWTLTMFILILGLSIFRKLKVHFSDVL